MNNEATWESASFICNMTMSLVWGRLPFILLAMGIVFVVWSVFISDEKVVIERYKDSLGPAFGIGMFIVFLCCLEAGFTDLGTRNFNYTVRHKTMQAELETMIAENPDQLDDKLKRLDEKTMQINGKEVIITTCVREVKDEKGYDHSFYVTKKVTKIPGVEDKVEYSLDKPKDCGKSK